MIDIGCKYYVGDDDCHKCLHRGLLFDCTGCDREGGKNVKKVDLHKVSVDDVIEYMGERAHKLRKDVNYMLTHGEHPDVISKSIEQARYYESTVKFLQELKRFENGLDEYIKRQEDRQSV